MEKGLQHLKDFKLIFTTLASPNGTVSLETLRESLDSSCLPINDCIVCWRNHASLDGSLGLDGFLKGIEDAMKNVNSKIAELSMKESIKQSCKPEELEGVLAQCNQKKLASALTRSRNDLYKNIEPDARRRKQDGEMGKTKMQSPPPKVVVSQPLNETEVLILVEQMLRSKTVDERYISEVIGQLSSAVGLQPQSLDMSRKPPSIHPQHMGGIKRSKSVKEEMRTHPSKSTARQNSNPGQSSADIEGSNITSAVKLKRSTSLKTDKHKTVKKHPPHHEEEVAVYLPPHASLPTHIPSQATYSKSMHDLTKEQLVGWMETQQRASAMKNAHRTASAQQVNQLHNSQPPIPQQSPKKMFKSNPDVYSTSKHGQPQGYTRQDLMQAEQYATLRYRDKHLKKRKDPAGMAASPVKNECKTLKSDYIAEIHRLRSEKEALIKQLFEQQASTTNKLDDSLISVL